MRPMAPQVLHFFEDSFAKDDTLVKDDTLMAEVTPRGMRTEPLSGYDGTCPC